MIIKKMLAVSCLFLVLPVCAMRRSTGVGRMGAGLLRRFACSGEVRNFALQAAVLNNKQRGRQNNRTFKLGGMPVCFMPKRLLCTDTGNEKEDIEMGIMEKYNNLFEQRNKTTIPKLSIYSAIISGLVLPCMVYDNNFLGFVLDAGVLTASLGVMGYVRQRCYHLETHMLSLIYQSPSLLKKVKKREKKEREKERERKEREQEEMREAKSEYITFQSIWTTVGLMTFATMLTSSYFT